MKVRAFLVSALLAAVAAAQAGVSFSLYAASTSGNFTPSGDFTPVAGGSGNVGTLDSTVNAVTSGNLPGLISLDFQAISSAGPVQSIAYNLFFLAPAAPTAKMKYSFSYNPVGVDEGGNAADLPGGVTSWPDYIPLSTVGSNVNIGGTNYVEVTSTIDVAAFKSKQWHLMFDGAFKDVTLAQANYTVNAVPEPMTMAVLGIGAFSLIARRRRTK